MKRLRNAALYVLHLAVAVFGSAFLSISIARVIHLRSVGASAVMACVVATFFGAVLGLVVYRTWRWKPAIWIWVPVGLFFGLVFLTTRSLPGGSWYWISGLACGQEERVGCVDFACTVMLLGCAGYSTGTLIGIRLR
jgi:hypothetical protein